MYAISASQVRAVWRRVEGPALRTLDGKTIWLSGRQGPAALVRLVYRPSPVCAGGRVWLACPGCGGARLTLYQPTVGTPLRCRACHGLTNASTQTSRKPCRERVVVGDAR